MHSILAIAVAAAASLNVRFAGDDDEIDLRLSQSRNIPPALLVVGKVHVHSMLSQDQTAALIPLAHERQDRDRR